MAVSEEQKAARREIAERVEEAYRVLRRVPDHERAWLTAQGSAWPSLIYDATKMEPGAWRAGAPVRLPPPSAAEISRMHEVLGWMLWLGKTYGNAARAVYLCCVRRFGPVDAGRWLGCHRETAAVWRDDGLDKISAFRARNVQ